MKKLTRDLVVPILLIATVPHIRDRREKIANLVLYNTAEPLRRITRLPKRAMRIQQRLTLEESYLLLQLSEAILDHGRLLQS
jgi:hypothetical protein